MHWARENKTSLNLLKTVELVFRRPNVSCDLLPPALPDINRVCDAKLLGVYFRHDFNFSRHVESVVTRCNQRLYLLAQLNKQDLGISDLTYEPVSRNRFYSSRTGSKTAGTRNRFLNVSLTHCIICVLYIIRK